MPKTVELIQILPVIVLVVAIGLVLLSALVFRGKLSTSALSWIVAIGLATAIVSAVSLFPAAKAAVGSVGSQGNYAANLISGSIIFDQLFLFMTIFLCVLFFGIFVVSLSLWQKDSWEWPIYWCLLLGSLIGMILLASTRHLIFFAIAFELSSIPSYVLVGFRKLNPKSAEGAAKYAIFGAVCSAIMVYGISLLYGLTGSFDFQTISIRLVGGGIQVMEIVALLFVLVGIGFKISLVPMHFWSPDALEAGGPDIGAWLSVASKSAAVIALARWVPMLAVSTGSDFSRDIVLALSAMAVLTMTVANLSAYWQTSVKRLLAYSSIAHAGYISCGAAILSGTSGLAAITAYIVVYMLMNLGAFAVTGVIEQQTGSDRIQDFAGLGFKNPALAACMMFFLFSLVGLPPLAGFAVKWILVSTLWRNNLEFLVAAILANTLLSMFYYMRIARAMYFESSDSPAFNTSPQINGLLAVCAGGLFFIFLGWGVLNSFTGQLQIAFFR
jgi:NADH-quinone oxidoreductase subunit N